MNENENIEQQTAEMTVGEILRNARTTGRRKREIQTIAKQLCIREDFLQALEDGNYTAIPEMVYILGFARNYAMELGLDPDEIVAKIKVEMGINTDGAGNVPGEVPTDDADEDAPATVASMATGSRVVQFLRRNWKWILGIVILVVAAIVAMVAFIPKSQEEVTPITNNVVTVAAPTETKYNVEIRERFGTENRETAEVVLQATEESWVKVEDARGNTVFSRVLVPGDIYYVPSGNKYKATFGNVGGIDAWVDGKLAPKIGVGHVRKAGISLTPSALMVGPTE